MRFVRYFAVAAFVAGLAPWSIAGANDPQIRLRPAQTQQLANGLELVVIPDARAPVVTHVLAYKVGSRDDPPGKTGLAHYLEHLLFKGTPRWPDGAYSATLESWGAGYNAFTSYMFTVYYATIPKEYLDQLMAMEADRMRNVRITPEMARTERDVVLEERFGRVSMNPQAALQENLMDALFAQTPISNPVIGHQADIETYTHTDALGLYRRYYAPNNAVLVISGDVDFAQAYQLAQKHYGPLLAGPTPTRPVIAAAATEPLPPIQVADPRTRQPSWQRIYRLSNEILRDMRLTTALDVMMDILGGHDASRLAVAHVVRNPDFLAIWAFADTQGREFGTANIMALPKPGQDPSVIGQIIAEDLKRLRTEPVTDTELATARIRLLARLAMEQDDSQHAALFRAIGMASGYTLAELDELPRILAALNTNDIQTIASLVLANTHIDGTLIADTAN